MKSIFDDAEADKPFDASIDRSVEGSVSRSIDASIDTPTLVRHLEEERDNSPVAEVLQQLPSYVSRGLIYLIVALIAVGVTYAGFSKLDEIKEAPALIVPEGSVVSIQPESDGIVTRLAVREGAKVVKGQTLAIVDSRELATFLGGVRSAELELSEARKELKDLVPLRKQQVLSQKDSIQKRIEGLQESDKSLQRKLVAERSRGQLIEATRELEIERENEEQKRLDLAVVDAKATAALWDKDLAANRRLRERGVVSELQFLQTERSHEDAHAAVVKSESMVREFGKGKQVTGKRHESDLLQHRQALSDLEEQIRQNQLLLEAATLELAAKDKELTLLDLESQRKLEQAQNRARHARDAVAMSFRGVSSEVFEQIVKGASGVTSQAVVTAPQAGTIGKVLVKHEGAAIARGQPMMTLIPEGAALQAEIRIAQKDVGLLKPGLTVKLKFDAFPYAEYGVIRGQLTQIISEAEQDSGQPSYYRAYSSLNQSYFRVKGRETPLLPGMTATAEIITEQKSVLSLFLQPFMELRKPSDADK